MKISKELLNKEAKSTGFKEEILEKVMHLITLLNKINVHPYLRDRLVLKGGTALNLFLFKLPRLSVDIDLNYIGQVNRELMQAERPKIEEALRILCENEGMEMRRAPNSADQAAHAGGKFEFRYDSAIGHRGKIEVDISYMYRITLFETQRAKSVEVGGRFSNDIQLLASEEVVAGKLSALFTRKAARDLYDVHHMAHNFKLDIKKLKPAFIFYGIMGPNDLRNFTADQVSFDRDEFYRNLIPVIKKENFVEPKHFNQWSNQFEMECRNFIKELISFNKDEENFIEQFYNNGELNFKLIDPNNILSKRIAEHPLLLWRKHQMANKSSSQ